ncbi:MAG: hypothetical protein GXX93_06690 [Anaerolineae bacterium]|nr:hypothetical protein [Anaerolineae bacterium]
MRRALASSLPGEATPVLVAVLNNHEDLRRAREEHWYRIPLARAPAHLAAHYLALYLTASLGAEGAAVRYWAEIERCEVVRRRDLLPEESDHPRAEGLYLCLRLGPLSELERPVPARRWRRLAFISTTWERLQAAEDVRDLPQRGQGPLAAEGAERAWMGGDGY